MKKGQIFYFADREDLFVLVKEIDLKSQLLFTKCGLFDDLKDIINLNSLLEVSSLGIVTSGDMNHNDSYLVTKLDDPPYVREVPQRKGGVKYAIDQKENSGSVVIVLSGEFTDSIVMGKIASIHSNSTSKEIEQNLCSVLRSMARVIQGIFVLKGSIKKAELGWPLMSCKGSATTLQL